MTCFFPNKPGRVILVLGNNAPVPMGHTMRDATEDEAIAIRSGRTWWNPATTELTAPVPPVPLEIANWRARAVLKLAGLITDVESQLAVMPGTDGIVARTAWESGSPLVRNGTTVRLLATKLGLTDQQVDDMFRQAAALQV